MNRYRALAVALPLAAAAFALTACGPAEESAPGTTVQVAADAAPVVVPLAEPVAAEQPEPISASLGATVALVDGVDLQVVVSVDANAYGVQFTSTGPEWTGRLGDFSGLDATGANVPLSGATMWPVNPNLGPDSSIVGGTLVFVAPVTQVVYSPPDAAPVVWS